MFGKFTRHRPSTAVVVVAVGAVAIVGTSSATAASLITGHQLGHHTIRGVNLKHHTIAGVNLKHRTIRGVNVKRHSLGLPLLTPYAISKLHGLRGATGLTGAVGPAGPMGPAGADGAVGPAGPAGADGATGPAGAAGAQGAAGANGADGADGATGPAGPQGDTGPAGPKGDTGPAGPAGAPATYSSLPWGLIGRNSFGTPVAAGRVGPGNAPLGIGSLGIEVAGPPPGDTNPSDAGKLSFGVSGSAFADETGITSPLAINSLSYQTFTDMDYSAGIATPGITIESDPDISDGSGAINYTSLVYDPPTPTSSQVGSWQTYNAADPTPAAGTGWYATGRAGAKTGCTLASPCSLTTLQAALGSNASIITVAITKGRDNAFIGAVDDLKINSSTFDFEPLGVSVS